MLIKGYDIISDSIAQSVEIDRLKQTLSEHLKEKESLMQTVTLLKNDFKKEESRNIDREIALEKRIKQLDNILEPKLYDGNVIKNTSAIVIPDSEETLLLAEESRLKILLKQKDPMMIEKKVNTTPVDYVVLINLKSAEISDLNASLQEKVLVVTAPRIEFKETKGKSLVDKEHPKLNANSELLCVKCNGCMLYDDHDLCVLDFINDMNARVKSKSIKITTTAKVSLRKPTTLETDTPKPVVTLVYSRKPRKSKTNVPVCKPKIIKSISAINKEPSKSWGSIVSDVPSSSLDECMSSKLFSVKFKNDHVAKILGYGDYQIGNVTISRVYYVEGLGHNLFSVGQFCDSNLEVAFRQHTCFIRNLDGVDLLTGSQGNNMYTLSLRDMMASSPICLLSKASKTNSLEPALHEMTPAIISLGLVPNPHPSTSFVPPSRTDWDILFQLLFDELLNPPSSVDRPFPEAIAPIAEVVAPEPAVSTDSPSSTIIDQDAPSPSNSQTTPETQSPAISNDIEEENHDLDVAHMNNDPFFSIPILENDSKASSSSNVIPTIVHTAAPNSEHVTKWTKDHPLDNIIGELDRPNYKDALTQACWIEAMQEELKEFEHLEVWKLVPRLDKVMAITLKWIYKVKLDELGGILKNKARWFRIGYPVKKGIRFEESLL
ncbi:retrovirus-related pol polyprotein from transposon TNT 1-94 [Tanacetum coccineum]